MDALVSGVSLCDRVASETRHWRHSSFSVAVACVIESTHPSIKPSVNTIADSFSMFVVLQFVVLTGFVDALAGVEEQSHQPCHQRAERDIEIT